MIDTRIDARRAIPALVAAAATGAVIYALTMYIALPGLADRTPHTQVEWLRQAFTDHPYVVMATILWISTLLGLPVLAVFWFVYRGRRR